MTTIPTRRTLPLIDEEFRHGSRSLKTCEYKCGNACDYSAPNTSDNAHVRESIGDLLQRRSLLKGAAAVGAGALVLTPNLAAAATGGAAGPRPVAAKPATANLGKAAFTPVAPNRRDAVVVPPGFDHNVVMRWGDPVLAGAPRFDPHQQSVEAARMQFGYNCDYVGVVPITDARGRATNRALMVVNHEYTNPELMFPSGVYGADEMKEIEIANHGMSVVEIKRGQVDGSWYAVKPSAKTVHNRRIHAGTEFKIDGPAAGSDLLKTSADPEGTTALGTFNNCAGGVTPWGTILSGEENFNQYFDKSGALDDSSGYYARLSLTGSGTRGWSSVEDRFDMTLEPNEPNRFGWVVEVDPFSPEEAPVKHTMLGRFKHEGANVTITESGYVVAYMGDDQAGDYLYKFVSSKKYVDSDKPSARKRNKKLLSHGTLYVAQLTGTDGDTTQAPYTGTGEWIPLCSDTTSYVPGMSVEQVLVFTRNAADLVGPTKMDRPEDVEVNPVNSKLYVALTNNSSRGNSAMPVDEANPIGSSTVYPVIGGAPAIQSGNRNGYVLEISPVADHLVLTFTWDLFLVCGHPDAPESWFAGFDKSQVSPISCPDNLAFDSVGNLWISTDGAYAPQGMNDGIHRVPVAGENRGKVETFITMP
ncbi:MAG: PhoX family protein, partial [Nocardioides sp.]